MRTICVTVNVDGAYTRSMASESIPLSQVQQHFVERGVEAQFFHGIDAGKLGIVTTRPYEVDKDWCMSAKAVGCWLSHRALWAACLLLPDDVFLIIEDDAKFPEDWRARIDQAVRDAGDFDLLYVGSCCTGDKPTTHIAGDVYEIQWPYCTHGYIVRRRALEALIATQDKAGCYAPIDISLTYHSLPLLKTFVVKPRILDQFYMDALLP